MPPRRAMRGEPWSEIVDVADSEDLSDDLAGIVIKDSCSSRATGQSGCVNQPWLPRENGILLHPPSPYGLISYCNEHEENMETEPEEDPEEDPVENLEEE
ncbi:unnamed protein product [Arabis nemorensis]|uniref:Uncharacterized protein n=1 Tax=Arabis nemorensis TaxID=586526 RepID=A0A565BJN4_9BRAS|nr:unnamed protein product [Arabis nemorensis]